MNDPISLAETHSVLTPPRLEVLLKCLSDVNREWDGEVARPGYDQTAKARSVSGRFYFRLTERLSTDPGVRHGEHGQQRFVAFDERLSIRCKLLDSALKHSNYSTMQAEAWVKPGIPLAGFTFDRLHFGYRLDPFGRELADVFVCQPTGNELHPNAWVWQIYGNPLNLQMFGVQQTFTQQSAKLSDFYLYEDYSHVI